MTVEELDAALGDVSFDDLDKTATGSIVVSGIEFSLRIGEYMGRPMEVIMADGQFVRMRAKPEYEHYALNKLDANNPSGAIYGFRPWVPNMPKQAEFTTVLATLSSVNVQHALAQQQAVAQYQTSIPQYNPVTGLYQPAPANHSHQQGLFQKVFSVGKALWSI